MAKELNENTSFKVSIQTLIGIGFGMATIISMWFVLQADIAEAKELPKPEVSKMEFQMKDENIRNTISALLPTTATESSNAQIANLVLGSALAPEQELQPITDVPGMTGAKVVSTGPFGNESISSVNLAAIPKALQKDKPINLNQMEWLERLVAMVKQ